MINLENASLRTAESDVGSIRRDLAQMQVRIARQRAQYVDAPMNGTVFRLLATGEAGGVLVRPGERLAILVPDVPASGSKSDVPTPGESGSPAAETTAALSNADIKSNKSPLTAPDHPGIVAELRIDGNDLPLIRKGDPVRLQFEGWPAVQFVGWPSVAVGTFGGRVYLVDPTADDKGHFRILVEPDPSDVPWPDQQFLRQGVRAQGWVAMNRVSIAWELWRRLNSFPPIRETEDKKSPQTLGPVSLSDRK
jgi:hypothetical protein